ncbi:hypothetical protein FAM09_08475 [Niastella caeni]|uniref:Anti-sigma factor n=1 Tax=Niastella caeni TaxID=2569763 RepID=A0A4S8HYL3_9BACT|nr:hypothetical protein [Niastella caeni]THU39919.1 hypothetical protein FAM09_08475 [Niastella caeni]
MSKGLEQFIRDNRNQFDSDEPGEQVWKKLEQELTDKNQTDEKQIAKNRQPILFTLFRWSAAAAILILAGIGIYSLLNDRSIRDKDVVQQPKSADTPVLNDPLLKEINPTYAREVVQFTQLIELKQNELKGIEKENPNLYKQFVADINKLDSSYNALQKELPENPNREQLLEAMIENLRLQTEILNQQLSIINQIKAAKNNNHESSFKKT